DFAGLMICLVAINYVSSFTALTARVKESNQVKRRKICSLSALRLKLHIVEENVSVGLVYPDRAKISGFIPDVITVNRIRREPIRSVIIMDASAKVLGGRRGNLFEVEFP